MPTYPDIGLKTVKILKLSCWYTEIEIDFEIIQSYMKMKYVMIDKTIQMTFGVEVSKIIIISKL